MPYTTKLKNFQKVSEGLKLAFPNKFIDLNSSFDLNLVKFNSIMVENDIIEINDIANEINKLLNNNTYSLEMIKDYFVVHYMFNNQMDIIDPSYQDGWKVDTEGVITLPTEKLNTWNEISKKIVSKELFLMKPNVLIYKGFPV